MHWKGETHDQWRERTLIWARAFALFPRQMNCGRWVWLEHYEVRREPTHNDNYFWVRRLEGSKGFEFGTVKPPASAYAQEGSVQLKEKG